MADKIENVFEKYWDMDSEKYSQDQKDLIRNKLRRQFEACYDSAKDEILELQEELKGMLIDNFDGFEINEYRRVTGTIKDYEDAMNEIAELHVKFFGESIRK